MFQYQRRPRHKFRYKVRIYLEAYIRWKTVRLEKRIVIVYIRITLDYRLNGKTILEGRNLNPNKWCKM